MRLTLRLRPVLALAAVIACRRGERSTVSGPSRVEAVATAALPGMPPVRDPANIYADAGAGMLDSVARRARPLVYVPDSKSDSVTVIDPRTYRVVRAFPVGRLPQHVVPSWDLRTLWVANNRSHTLIPIDPVTGRDGPPVPVTDPYNLYFTPDGKYAVVVAERLQRLDFRDARTMRAVDSIPVACRGVDHLEFTADGRWALATCEFTGQLLKLDVAARRVVGYLTLDPAGLGAAAMPQDIRSAPDGKVFYVADMKAGGVYLVNPVAFRRIGFLHTGTGAHGIYPSRDGTRLYVANRGWNTTAGGRHGPGSVSVIDPATRSVVATWPVPGGGSPDMGNVSADGTELWLSGRYDAEVYVFDTRTGALTHRIPVGREPHGLTVWPQPGRYSLGHTGNMR
jgi:YVTN family beta-propeller protein